MEYHLTKKTISRLCYALDTVSEQAVDIDLTLPDYCPDIEKILSCTLIPEINLSNVSADRLTAEGNSVVRILYLDSDKAIRMYEYSVPFSESFPLKGEDPDRVAYLDTKPEYLNCRALSPRKLSLHGAFSLSARVATKQAQPYFAYEDSEGLQTKREALSVSALSGMCSEPFTVQEDISVSSKGEIKTLLSHRLTAHISEVKAIQNKIMLNAELRLELLALAGLDDPEVSCMSYSVPISRVIDCEGVDENAVIDSELSVMSDHVRLSDDALDGSSILTLDARLCFNALCYAAKEIEILTDAFSTDAQAQVQTEPFSCHTETVCRAFTDVGKANITLEEEIGRILDVHCEKLSAVGALADGAMTIRTKMTVGIIYETTEKEKRCVDRDVEFTYRPDIEGSFELLSLRACAQSLSYRLKDAFGIELRAEIGYRMTLCKPLSCAAVTGVSADDDAPDIRPDGTLILYYADTGDRIWDIAKRFRSRPADIISENGLEGDTVSAGMMLMIPTA